MASYFVNSARTLDEFAVWSLSAGSGFVSEQRENASLRDDALRDLKSRMEVDLKVGGGFFYIGTCHRIEIYFFGIDPHKLLSHWRELRPGFFRMPILKRGMEAVEHLVKVISGLESEVVGETQIAGQVRTMVRDARRAGSLQGMLNRVVEYSFWAAKRVRYESGLGRGVVSVAHIAIDGLKEFYEAFDQKRVLVVGAGPMAIQAIERLFHIGIHDVTWANRSQARMEAHHLSRFVTLASLDRVMDLIWEHDVSVFAVSVDRFLISHDLMDRMPRKGLRPRMRVLLDLGLPRNVDPALHGQKGIFLRDVDQFNSRAMDATAERRRVILQAETVLSHVLRDLGAKWEEWQRPVELEDVRTFLEQALIEFLKSSHYQHLQDFTPLAHRFSGKMLRHFVQALESRDPEWSTQVVGFLRAAFESGGGALPERLTETEMSREEQQSSSQIGDGERYNDDQEHSNKPKGGQ